MAARPWRAGAAVVVALAVVSLLIPGCGGGSEEVARSGVRIPVETTLLDGLRRPGSADVDGDADGAADAEPDGFGATDGASVRLGAEVLLNDDLADLRGQRIGLIANRAATVGGEPVIDLFHRHPGVDLTMVFAPEHGVEADAAAGAEVADGVDGPTGVVVTSLYGSERGPTPEALVGLDMVVFDLQDAGARWYTYTATMGLAMQAAAEAGLPFVVLDRPNPLGGDVVDGPIADEEHFSFVGPYPVPALHGLTPGELAKAIQGEGWLDGLGDLDLRVVELDGWTRGQRWEDTGLDWVAPSPGLPTVESVLLYPATVLLEATTVSFGGGTEHPFGQFGAPWLDNEAAAETLEAAELAGVGFEAVVFTPGGADGGSGARYDGQTIPGVRLHIIDRAAIRPLAIGIEILAVLLAQAEDPPPAQEGAEDGTEDGGVQVIEVIDRPDFFDKLAGQATLREDLLAGRDPSEIVASWSADLEDWRQIEDRYRIYEP